MRKGILAMEELDEVVADNAAVETLEAPAEETEGLAEVEAAETEVVADTEETGEVIETADTLDEVREGVEEAAETEGGLAEPEARALNAAVEGLLITLGARGANAKVFPAMEGFRDPATRARVTMEAAGGIGDKVKQVWAKLVEMLKKAWEMISNFFKAITTAAGRLGMRAEKVKKAAAKNSGWTGRRPVATKKWGAKLSVGTSVAGGAELAGKINDFASNKAISFDYASAVNGASKTIVAALGQVGGEGAGEGVETAAAAIAKSATDLNGTEMPLGNAVLKVEKAGEETGYTVSLEASSKGAVAEEVPAMIPAEVSKTCDAIIAQAKKFTEYEKQASNIGTTLKMVGDKVKSLASKGTGDDKLIRDSVRSISAMRAVLISTGVKVRSYELMTCHAALDYAAASMATVGKKELEGKPA